MKVKISDIMVIHNKMTTRRIRKQIGNVTRLADSIKKHGLMHPIVVCPSDSQDYKWTLIAGERRLRACILNGYDEIECTLFGDLDSTDQKVCELEENIVRKNLSWQEECDALRQLDDLMKMKYGKAQPGSTTGWRLDDTADAVGIPRSTVASDVKLARDLRENPELQEKVKKIPKTAARKVVKQAVKAKLLKKQVEMNELKVASNLLLGNACDLIDDLEDESVHLLLTDPPFGISQITSTGKSGTMSYSITSTNVSDEDVMRDTYRKLWPKVFTKLVPGAHIYVFCAMGWYCELITMLRKAGFVMSDLPLIWYKRRTTTIPKGLNYMSSYEAILFGYKHPPERYLKKNFANVLSIPAISPQMKIHGLQKPFDLLKILIENSSNPGELILDCFAGSGMTLIAAEKLHRSSIGYEIDESNFYRAQEFINKEIGKE